MPSRVVALWCWYHGDAFRGYQSQPVGPTVQEVLIKALRAAGFERNPVPAGRTDAGVHARMQVLSMRVFDDGPLEAVAARLNAQLPPTLGIALIKPADRKFHAAWRASGKVYRYGLSTAREEPGTWKVAFDRGRLEQALGLMVGERDFGALHDPSSSRKARLIERVEVTERDGRVVVRVRGAGFARYQVRLMIGAAVAIARDEKPLSALEAALADPTRTDFHRLRAPADGLVLDEVLYPPEVDPFSAEERREGRGVPRRPPFVD